VAGGRTPSSKENNALLAKLSAAKAIERNGRFFVARNATKQYNETATFAKSVASPMPARSVVITDEFTAVITNAPRSKRTMIAAITMPQPPENVAELPLRQRFRIASISGIAQGLTRKR
jgi:hypothetical protein